MSEPEALTPQAATEQRATLMSDSGFRQRAAAGGAEWQQVADLDRAIAAGRDAEEAAQEAQESAIQHASIEAPTQADDDEPGFEPPASPSGYDLPLQEARAAGLPVDFAAEAEMRTALHAAGVDGHMASLIYTAAIGAATKPATPVQAATEYHASETALRKAWGAGYDANLAAANAEAKGIFLSMPRSVTGGLSFAEWCAQSGMANNRVLVQELHRRAIARK